MEVGLDPSLSAGFAVINYTLRQPDGFDLVASGLRGGS